MKKLKDIFKSFFSYQDGPKTKIHLIRVIMPIFVFYLLLQTNLLLFDFESIDPTNPQNTDQSSVEEHSQSASDYYKKSRSDESAHKKKKSDAKPQKNKRRSVSISQASKQIVLKPSQASFLPLGTSCIAKLLTLVDSRYPSSIKGILPYGCSFKKSAIIPQNSTLFGQFQYNGKGDRVFLEFHTVLFPSGIEKTIQGMALDSKTYSTGILGTAHSGTGTRIATSLGMRFLSNVTDVLTQKESLSQYGDITAKPTLKDGIYQGVSDVARSEAERQLKEAGGEEEYVTLEPETPFIFSLTSSFSPKKEH